MADTHHVFGRVEFEYDQATEESAGLIQAVVNEAVTQFLLSRQANDTLGVWTRAAVDDVVAIWGSDTVFDAAPVSTGG